MYKPLKPLLMELRSGLAAEGRQEDEKIAVPVKGD